MNEKYKIESILKYSKEFNQKNLSPLRSGNISIRHRKKNDGGFLITPSGKKYQNLTEKDIVFVNYLGQNHHNFNSPSSEWNFHLELYKETKCNAIVHCHSKYALILSCFQKSIPAFHYMIAIAGGSNIRCAEYNLFGTNDLSKSIIKAIKDRKACLISNHGQITIGENIDEAFELAQEVEFLCECYYKCILIEKPKLISEQEMIRVLKKIQNYKKK